MEKKIVCKKCGYNGVPYIKKVSWGFLIVSIFVPPLLPIWIIMKITELSGNKYCKSCKSKIK